MMFSFSSIAERGLYSARLVDLEPGDLVLFECACGHTMVLTPMMLKTAGVKPAEKLLDLESRSRCRERDSRGKAVVSIRWRGALDRE